MMIIKRCVTVLTLLASCAALSYAQADGGIGGHAPARSYAATSTNFTVPGASCAGATPGNDVALDCAEFGPPGAVQEVFAFYNQIRRRIQLPDRKLAIHRGELWSACRMP